MKDAATVPKPAKRPGWFSRMIGLVRETPTFLDLLGRPRDSRPFVVYSEDAYSYVQFEGYLDELTRTHGRDVIYVTSDRNDPLLARPPPRFEVHHLNHLVPSFLRKLDSRVVLTTLPDLGRMHVPRPPASCTLVYAFHSLNSIQAVYRHRAFDNYDVFFSCGPHHDRELAAHFPLYGLPTPQIRPVGYYKLDRVARDHARHVRRHPDRTTVLVAPSWGNDNLLEGHGAAVISPLLDAGYRVVVRPHPCFFEPLYPKGNRIVVELQERFGSHPSFVLEGRFTDEESFHEAEVMISDWSGASFEYALGTGRPVLFLDVPRKVFNPEWERIGSTPFEEGMRRVVGEVLAPSELGTIARRVASLLERPHEWRERIEEARVRDIHHFGRSARAGAAILNELLEKGKGS